MHLALLLTHQVQQEAEAHDVQRHWCLVPKTSLPRQPPPVVIGSPAVMLSLRVIRLKATPSSRPTRSALKVI